MELPRKPPLPITKVLNYNNILSLGLGRPLPPLLWQFSEISWYFFFEGFPRGDSARLSKSKLLLAWLNNMYPAPVKNEPLNCLQHCVILSFTPEASNGQFCFSIQSNLVNHRFWRAISVCLSFTRKRHHTSTKSLIYQDISSKDGHPKNYFH